LPNIAECLKTLGAIAGAVALVWRFIDEFGSHLRIAVTVETDSAADGWLTVLTTLDNKGNRPKGIEYAMVLVGPESENPVETARILARAVGYAEPLGYTNDFVGFRVIDPVIQEDRALIPLPFYYQENVDIADETSRTGLLFRLVGSVEGCHMAFGSFSSLQVGVYIVRQRIHSCCVNPQIHPCAPSKSAAWFGVHGEGRDCAAEGSRQHRRPNRHHNIPRCRSRGRASCRSTGRFRWYISAGCGGARPSSRAGCRQASCAGALRVRR
jgi:hypothetical protein